ncbi:unnamed protein product [Chilo suppressalis]|uniref:HORMA domain-containing protein n=1 Tax=Chilo suppressalis TaxID=168631 RepID=A0ABN8L3T3_CHISP|nr:unnamed protein product [Chilo suppressalis]
MTATATPTSQAITEWTKIFPKQITENYTSSVTFMKQLTVIAVSTITYLKNAFPEESYFIENFGGLKLRILKQKCRDELAQFLSTALTQAFEAFDKKYLHQLALCFYEDECKAENLIEYHVFEYSYNSEAVTLSVHSKGQDGAAQTRKFTFDSVRERTMHLIRACVVIMQTCQFELPENYDVSLRLYYNEHAPDGYQAPGFSASEEGEEHVRAHAGDAVKLGCVETPYHRLLARTYIRETLRASHEAIPSQNPPMMSQMEPDIDESMTKELSECSETSLLQCPCNKGDSDTDSAGPLLTCQYCKTHQHAACFGLTPENAGQLTEHCCANCSDEDPTRVPTDQRLVSLSRNKREFFLLAVPVHLQTRIVVVRAIGSGERPRPVRSSRRVRHQRHQADAPAALARRRAAPHPPRPNHATEDNDRTSEFSYEQVLPSNWRRKLGRSSARRNIRLAGEPVRPCRRCSQSIRKSVFTKRF